MYITVMTSLDSHINPKNYMYIRTPKALVTVHVYSKNLKSDNHIMKNAA